MRDSHEKGTGMRDQDPPFQTLLARSLSDERIAQAAGDTTIVVSGGCSN